MQPNDTNKPNTRANFLIQVQYRHNSSWQGRIVWLDTKQTIVFRSFMELVMLMQEALQEENSVNQQCVWEMRQEVL
jgi:hypothetical protein